MTTPQKGRIFISYRRTDSAGYAGRIFDRLAARFGEDAVFMDVDTIEAGLDFVAVLQNAVRSCDVLVVLIGRQWLNVTDESGKRRLDNPEDFVRVEIAAALSRDIRVIPVLVDEASIPHSTELPENLKPLSRRNALQVNHSTFNADAHRLISQLELALKAAEDAKILKAQALQEEQARAQSRAEIQRLLDAADLAISLKDWNLAQEKLKGVLALDASHVGARDKLDIVQRRLSEIEQGRVEQARKEQAAREQAVAEERARLAASQKAQAEREEQERRAAAEKARKEKEERERKAAPAVPVGQAASPTDTKTGKPAWLPYGIGGGVVLVIAILFGIGALIRNALAPDSPTPTSRPLTEAPVAIVLTEIATSNSTDTAEPQGQPTTAAQGPGIGSTMVLEKDGMAMVYVPAGGFRMGSDADEALAECQKFRTDCQRDWFTYEEPIHTVDLNAFWIDQTEVTNAMYARCVEDGKCEPPSSIKSYTRESYYNNPEFRDYPVIYITWNNAAAYCEWTGRRLPTEAEWEKAAGWDEHAQAQRVYPWGNTFDGSIVNFCDTNCSLDWKNSEYDDNFADTAPVGSYPAGVSFYGVYDMAGNVWEWVADWYGSDYYASSPSSNPAGPDSGSSRVLRGGAWSYLDYVVRSASRGWNDPSLTFNDVGFRCSRSAVSP